MHSCTRESKWNAFLSVCTSCRSIWMFNGICGLREFKKKRNVIRQTTFYLLVIDEYWVSPWIRCVVHLLVLSCCFDVKPFFLFSFLKSSILLLFMRQMVCIPWMHLFILEIISHMHVDRDQRLFTDGKLNVAWRGVSTIFKTWKHQEVLLLRDVASYLKHDNLLNSQIVGIESKT